MAPLLGEIQSVGLRWRAKAGAYKARPSNGAVLPWGRLKPKRYALGNISDLHMAYNF